MAGEISQIEWPENFKSNPHMSYESIAPLHIANQGDGSCDNISVAVASTNLDLDPSKPRGCIQKLDIIAGPTLADAKIKVSHEVLPGQGACSQIIPVNEELLASCFDAGSVLPISNFGPKKTFHCDVRGRLQHHDSPVNCIASDSDGTQLASGSTGGEIALYEVSGKSITYTSRVNVCSSSITGLAYIKPFEDICLRPSENSVTDSEDILIYSTFMGHIGLLDTRCDLGQQIEFGRLMTTQPRVNLTSLCYIDTLPGQVIFFGSAHGHLIGVDLRCNKKYLVDRKLAEDGCIRRMKQVRIQTEDNKITSCLAYTNETSTIKIIDPKSLETHERWKCDRLSTGIIKDFCQVGQRIITCGSESTIGCWTWDDLSNE